MLSHYRTMYWTDWGTPPKIESASMDGANRNAVITTDLYWPNALTLDYQNQILYWADAWLDKVEMSTTTGANRRVLSNLYIYHPFGITFCDGHLYWTDWGLNSILRSPASISFEPSYVWRGLRLNPMGIQMMGCNKGVYNLHLELKFH